MEYYAILIVVALIVLIGALVFIGVKMTSTTSIAPYPPVAYSCPDYWMSDNTGRCIAGTKNTGSFKQGYTFNPDEIQFTGLTPVCSKQKWALKNNLVWTGVTEYNQCSS